MAKLSLLVQRLAILIIDPKYYITMMVVRRGMAAMMTRGLANVYQGLSMGEHLSEMFSMCSPPQFLFIRIL